MLTCLVPVLFTFHIQGVLKIKINSGAKGLSLMKACHRSVYSPVKACLLSKNVNRETHSNIIVRVVLYGCGTWSMKHRSSLCGNGVVIRLQETTQ